MLDDGAWVSAGDTILGADNKAAVAVLLEVARRCAIEGAPVGLELLFTVSEENALAGAKAFDVEHAAQRLGLRLRPRLADRRDHRRLADLLPLRGRLPRRRRARRHPPRGRAQRDRGRRARDRRDDASGASTTRRPRTSARSTAASAAGRTSSPSAAGSWGRRARSIAAKAEAVVAELIDHIHDAANTPRCACDVDVTTARLFDGYRHAPSAPAVLAAERGAARARLHAARRAHRRRLGRQRARGAGLRLHEPRQRHRVQPRARERVSVAALEGMLDVTFALLDACSD